jgi:hypothetical protein
MAGSPRNSFERGLGDKLERNDFDTEGSRKHIEAQIETLENQKQPLTDEQRKHLDGMRERLEEIKADPEAEQKPNEDFEETT